MGKAETASSNTTVSGAADSGESRDGGTRAVSFSGLLLGTLYFAFMVAIGAASLVVHARVASPSPRAHYRSHNGVALNDLTVSPGEVRGIDRKDICNKPAGWTDEFRATTEKMKEEVYAEYGVDKHKFNRAVFCTGIVRCDTDKEWAEKNKGHKVPLPLYEIDHLDSLQLDGADTTANMMPQPYYAHPGAHEKDAAENRARALVCANPPKMDLQEAQRELATDWYQFYLNQHLQPASKTGAESEGAPGELRAQWSERSGYFPAGMYAARYPAIGEWRCPRGYLPAKRNGKLAGLGDIRDERSVLGCIPRAD